MNGGEYKVCPPNGCALCLVLLLIKELFKKH